MSTRDQLLAEIDAFLLKAGMNDYEFGIQAMNDRAFLFRLRRGRSIKIDTIDKIRKFMRDYRRPLGRRVDSRTAA